MKWFSSVNQTMTVADFHDFPGLENGLTKFHDFPGRVVTLFSAVGDWNVSEMTILCPVECNALTQSIKPSLPLTSLHANLSVILIPHIDLIILISAC